MSLLMDALRKAEEAKKTAAQENKFEVAVPAAAAEKQQGSIVVEKPSEEFPASEIGLSLEAMEEPSKHSAPNLETVIAFEDDEAAPETTIAVASDTKTSGTKQGSREISKVAGKARDTDEPVRKAARGVFAAKKSPLLKNLNSKAVAGGALALFLVAFGAYFYMSINRESTFNIPVESYATTDFVGSGVSSETQGDQISINTVTVVQAEETAATNVGDSTLGQLFIPADADTSNAAAAPPPVSTLIVPPVLEIVAVPETSRSVESLQPDTIADETPQPETVVTTVADASEVTIESEVTVQPAVGLGVQSTALVEPTSLISFSKQESVVRVDPNVARAYVAYQQGSINQAEVLYRQTLAAEPGQHDALLGLANITARNGNTTEALDLYSRLLARNPSDPIARVGLMELLPAGSPSVQEAKLKRLLNDHSDVAALSYAYGNFLASNQRWPEAQQAYFRALQLAKTDAILNGRVNPDYAFNLAVSLEHLNQTKPAQNYYREALDYSANHPAGFNLIALRSRLANMAGTSNDE